MEEFAELAIDVLQDAFFDTVRLLPFLLITYLIMEALEHKTGSKTQDAVRRAGVAGPAVGALLGMFPQCGFSAAAATLYAGRVITLGTLFAVFLSTSDEMLPIFIAEQAPASAIFAILGCKVIIGMVMGFAVDLFLRSRNTPEEGLRIHELCKRDKCDCRYECETCAHHPEEIYHHHDDCAQGCDHTHHAHEHSHDGEHGWSHILLAACKHTLEVTVFILLISVCLNFAIELIGEEALASFAGQNGALSVVVSAIVGLIPNCAASIVIAQMYLEGVIGAGAMMSGLLVSAGVGILVLLRSNRPAKQNILIILALLAMGIVWGFIFMALGITF